MHIYPHDVDRWACRICKLHKTLRNREKPGDPEYIEIDNQKIPFFLNHAQCQLHLHNYYDVITYADEVLSRDKGGE